MKNILKFCLFSSLILIILCEKDYFVLISVEQKLTPPKIIQFNLKSNRESANVYAVNGNLTILKDLFADTQISGQIYRSLLANNNEYILTPYKIEKQSLKTFFNTGYKTIFMENTKECSTLPQFDDEWEPPLKANVYLINNCKGNASSLPEFITSGYYKFDFNVYHENNAYLLEIIFKVARQ